ncbi:hypothetical protein [Abyssogena phaseoliformis symbiont]|uniref:hypothetical protein n=1 Tax=Abyssogena phaseoliformis symbiont TaxID=596095 RepID=UPI0019152B50|nr:hypothetical protein [Abyssogena phaseoliformis symbiont]
MIIDTQTYSSFDADGYLIKLSEEDEFADEPSEVSEQLYLSDTENTEIVIKIQQIIKAFQVDNFDIYLTGSAVIAGTLKQIIPSFLLASCYRWHDSFIECLL